MANERVEGTLIPATATLARVIGAGQSGNQIARAVMFNLTNHDLSNNRSFQLYFKPQAESLDTTKHKTFNVLLKKGASRRINLPLINLQEGDEIHWQASAASLVAGSISLDEINEDSAYVNIPAQYAPNGTFDDIRQVPSGLQCGGLLLGAHNTDSVAREVEFRAVESGASTAQRYTIWQRRGDNPLKPGETDWSFWPYEFLTGIGAYQAGADAVDKVVVFGGLTEFVIS